ncbi:MAG: hypothetical protein ACFE0I_01675 [Elainellaceae cyanobacterium]
MTYPKRWINQARDRTSFVPDEVWLAGLIALIATDGASSAALQTL